MKVPAATVFALLSSAVPPEAGQRWPVDGVLGFLATDCRPGSAFTAFRDHVIAEAVVRGRDRFTASLAIGGKIALGGLASAEREWETGTVLVTVPLHLASFDGLPVTVLTLRVGAGDPPFDVALEFDHPPRAVAARFADALARSPHAGGLAGAHHLVEADFRGNGRSVLRCFIPARAAVP